MLVVDDDPGLRDAVGRALRLEGYDVSFAADGLAAIEAAGDDPDAMVLDVSMPNMGGLDVCRRLRDEGNRLPILVLTARHTVSDRVAGLDAGADDYLVKPFALEELLARVRALVRRSTPPESGERFAVGDLTLETGSREVRRGDRSIELTRTEFDLLELLMRNAGQVLTREVISERVGQQNFATSNSLEVYIGYLRRKLEAGDEARLIHTVRGVGYVCR